MKNIITSLVFTLFSVVGYTQCNDVAIQVSSSTVSSVQLYHAGFFNIPSGFANVCDWEVTDFSGGIIHEETTSGAWADQSFILFNHSIPTTDSMKVSLLITNETSGITCLMNDTLIWSGNIINWEVLSNNPGIEITLDLELIDSMGVSCFGGNDGFISVAASGGDAPYSYSIDDGPFTSSPNFDNLEAGEHTVVVNDNSGNMSTLIVELSWPLELFVDIVKEDVSCFGGSNGEIIANASGGTSINGYSYYINDDGPNTSGIFSDLGVGSYEILVEDDNACLTVTTVEIIQPAQIVVDSIMLTHLLCNSDSTGSINFMVSGGTSPYSYAFDDQQSFSSLPISDLNAGAYSITVSDQDSCTVTFNVEILEPEALTLSITSLVNNNCDEDDIGSVALLAEGGTQEYTYTVDGESNTTGEFSNLATGDYIAMLVDGNECMAETTFTIELEIDIEVSYEIIHPSCSGDSTGAISVLVTGGNEGYTFYMNEIEMDSSEFTGLGAGIFYIAIENESGCEFKDTLTVDYLSTLALDSIIVENVDCSAGEGGRIEIIATSNQGDLNYSLNGLANSTGIFENLTDGMYLINVADELGCMIEEQVTIVQGDQFTGDIDLLQSVSCFGESDGEVYISINGTTEGYEFQLDSITNSTGIFTNLLPGDYLVVINNAQNCMTEIQFVIEDVEPLEIELIEVMGDDGSGNGSITVEGNGGTEPYVYSINGGTTLQDNPTISGLENEMYTVLIQDANGCMDSLIVLLTSIDVQDLSTRIKIFPSPVEIGGALTIQSTYSIESILIVDVQGQFVQKKSYESNDIKIETSTFKDGIYLLGVKTKQGVLWQKILIIK